MENNPLTIFNAKKLKILSFLAIIVIAFGVRIFGAGETGLVAGEEFWLSRGEDIVSHLSKGDAKNSTETFERHPGIPAALLVGLSMKYLNGPKGLMTTLSAARLPIIIFGALSCGLLFWFVLRAFKNLPLAAISGLVLALDPFHIALSRMAHQDIALSFFFTASLFLYFLGEKEGKNKLKILAGVFFGFALLTKIVAILIPLIIFGWKITEFFLKRKNEEKFISRKLPFDLIDITSLIIGFGMFFILYPKMWDNPIAEFIKHIEMNIGKNTSQESHLFFQKNIKGSNFMFYPIAILIRMTLVSVIGFFAGIYFWFKKRKSHKKIFFLLIIWLLAVVLIMSSFSKIKDRYITPIWIILALFSGYGIYYLTIKVLKKSKLRFLISFLAIIIFTLPSIFYLYPNYLFFFNSPTNLLYGGFNIIDANTSICLKEAAEKLNKLPGINNQSVIISFRPGFEQYFRGKTVLWNAKEKSERTYSGAEYVVLNINNMSNHSPKQLYGIFKDEKPIDSVWANGLECAWIYKNLKEEISRYEP